MVISICTHLFYSHLFITYVNSSKCLRRKKCMSNALTPCPAPGVLFWRCSPELRGQARREKQAFLLQGSTHTAQENGSISALVCCCFRAAAIMRISCTGVQSNSWACGWSLCSKAAISCFITWFNFLVFDPVKTNLQQVTLNTDRGKEGIYVQDSALTSLLSKEAVDPSSLVVSHNLTMHLTDMFFVQDE